MGRFLFSVSVIFIFTCAILYLLFNQHPPLPQSTWTIQSVDTMKFSRDLALEKLNDPSFDAVIDHQMTLISRTGANYVAIGTPYDPQFNPILRRWVASARRHHLKVWFRGNLAGWEGWFSYPKIGFADRQLKINQFINGNSDIFEDGDIFTSCPECENGADLSYSDPSTFDNLRNSLVQEYNAVNAAFSRIGKKVSANYYSMNYDVATRVMDRQTTQELGGIVVIDHYVKDPLTLAQDVRSLAEKTGGKIVLGEFGAPIPDIHGEMTPAQQDAWLRDAFIALAGQSSLLGINYWTSFGGSTAIWDSDFSPRLAVDTLTRFYTGKAIKGIISGYGDLPISNARIMAGNTIVYSDSRGVFYLPALSHGQKVFISLRKHKDSVVYSQDTGTLMRIIVDNKKDGLLGNVMSMLGYR